MDPQAQQKIQQLKDELSQVRSMIDQQRKTLDRMGSILGNISSSQKTKPQEFKKANLSAKTTSPKSALELSQKITPPVAPTNETKIQKSPASEELTKTVARAQAQAPAQTQATPSFKDTLIAKNHVPNTPSFTAANPVAVKEAAPTSGASLLDQLLSEKETTPPVAPQQNIQTPVAPQVVTSPIQNAAPKVVAPTSFTPPVGAVPTSVPTQPLVYQPPVVTPTIATPPISTPPISSSVPTQPLAYQPSIVTIEKKPTQNEPLILTQKQKDILGMIPAQMFIQQAGLGNVQAEFSAVAATLKKLAPIHAPSDEKESVIAFITRVSPGVIV